MRKRGIIFSMLAVLLGIGIGTHQMTAHAAELNQAGISDRMTFATNSMPQGGLSTFTVEFTEKTRDQIKPGDTLTMTFPAGLEGLRNNGQDYVIPLKNAQGIHFGTARVSQGQAVVTFEEAVDKLDNIRGNFTIGFVASNRLLATNTVINTSLGLDVPVQKLTVPGIPTQKPGKVEGPFTHYKAGDMLNGADNVRWFININPYEQGVNFTEPIVIKDKQGPGQQLNKDSFAISISWRDPNTGKEAGRYMSVAEVEKLGWAKFTFDEANGAFEVVINAHQYPAIVSGKRVSLQYTSKVLPGAPVKLENEYSIHYRRNTDAKPVDDQAKSFVDRVVMGGGADGDGRPLPVPPSSKQELKYGIDETAVIEEEEVGIIEDPKTEHGSETTQPDETHKAEQNNPDILNDSQLIEETLTEEQIEILEDVIQEHIDGKLEEGHTHVIEIDGVPHIMTDKEIVEKFLTPDQRQKLNKVIEKHADMSDKKNVTKKSDKQATEKKSENKKSDDLPATGYNSGMMLSIAGLVLVVVLGIFFYKKRR